MLKLEPGSKQDLGGQVAQVLVENCCFSYLSLRPSLQFPHRHYRIFILVSVADILSGAKNFCAKMPRKYRSLGIDAHDSGRCQIFFGCLCKFGFFVYYSRWTTYSNPATRTMLNPRAPNLNVSARMLPKMMLGVWFLSSIGANALQVSSGCINIELWGRGGCTW